MRRVGHVDFGDLEIARLEPVGAVIELQCIQLGQDRHKFRQRIVGQMRVSDVPLRALDRDPDIDRAAPPDFHHVAQLVHAGGLADQAQVWLVTLLVHIVDQGARTVQRGAFLSGCK